MCCVMWHSLFPVFANPRSMHAIEAGDDSGDYLSSAQELLEQRRPSSRSARRQRRKAIIASLIRALLEPSSPADSDDEIERYFLRSGLSSFLSPLREVVEVLHAHLPCI